MSPGVVADALASGQAVIEDAVRRQLQRAHDSGTLAPRLGVEEALGLLTLAWHGLMVLARSGENPDELARRADAAVDTVSA